jgi:hypothetical protein
MGYNIGAKGVAIGLLALTNGDRDRAEAVWDRVAFLDPVDVSQALDFVEEALGAEPAKTSGVGEQPQPWD